MHSLHTLYSFAKHHILAISFYRAERPLQLVLNSKNDHSQVLHQDHQCQELALLR